MAIQHPLRLLSSEKTDSEGGVLVAATRAYDQVANTLLREDDKKKLRKLTGEDL